MTRNKHGGWAVAAAACCLLPIFLAPAAEPIGKLQFFTGKVVPLKDVLGKLDIKLDPDAVPYWLALVTDEGKVYPLIKSDGARMFFKEPMLQQRPMRITGRLLTDTNLLQAIQVHSVKEGKLYEVYYWCDICVIKRFEKMDCDCCGAPMELRETRVEK